MSIVLNSYRITRRVFGHTKRHSTRWSAFAFRIAAETFFFLGLVCWQVRVELANLQEDSDERP